MKKTASKLNNNMFYNILKGRFFLVKIIAYYNFRISIYKLQLFLYNNIRFKYKIGILNKISNLRQERDKFFKIIQ